MPGKTRNYPEWMKHQAVKIFKSASTIAETLDIVKTDLNCNINIRTIQKWAEDPRYENQTNEVMLFNTNVNIPERKIEPQRLKPVMSRKEFEAKAKLYIGEDFERDRALIEKIYSEVSSDRINTAIKEKTIDELLQLKGVIEHQKQKREMHFIKLMEFVEIKEEGSEPSMEDMDDVEIKKINNSIKDKMNAI